MFNTKVDKKAIFINEQDLKIILLKVKTNEAKVFQEWILKQSTIMKAVIKHVINIKHEQDIQKIKEENDRYKQQLEQQNKTKDNLMERTLKAVENYKQPVRNAGKIYIATSPEYQKQFTYKIGLTTIETAKREKSLQTSCPNINIIYDIDVKDVDLAESLIHTYLNHLNVDKEFYYISSVDIAKDIINYCCNFVNNLILKYDNDYNILRKQYIASHDIIITLPLIQSRGRSPVRRVGHRSKSPNRQLLLENNNKLYDLNDSNTLFLLNRNLKFNNLYHCVKEKQQIINELINIKLTDEADVLNNIDNNSKTSKLLIKKFILSKIFNLQNEQINKEFLTEWLDKEYILDNALYATGKKKLNDSNDPYLNNVRLKLEYLHKILKVYGFKHLFDFETVAVKDDAMELRMQNSKLLEAIEYEKLMLCFGKRQRGNINKCNLSKYIMISDLILNDFGIGLNSNRNRQRTDNNSIYIIKYNLIEKKSNITKY